MATLPTSERRQIWRALMRHWSSVRELLAGINKTDLQEAVDATDTWMDANFSSLNSSFPVTFRTNATASQKALMISAVAARRAGLDFLRRLLGEVD